MKLLNAIVLGVVIATPALIAAAPLAGDLDKLKGKWTGKVGANQDVPIVIEFKDKEIVIEIESGEGEKAMMTGEFLINENASPKTIDFTNFKGPNGDQAEDVKGIYEFKDATLRICTKGPGEDRPTEYLPVDENGHGTIVFTRAN